MTATTNCSTCNRKIGGKAKLIAFVLCNTFTHKTCLSLSLKDVDKIAQQSSEFAFICAACRPTISTWASQNKVQQISHTSQQSQILSSIKYASILNLHRNYRNIRIFPHKQQTTLPRRSISRWSVDNINSLITEQKRIAHIVQNLTTNATSNLIQRRNTFSGSHSSTSSSTTCTSRKTFHSVITFQPADQNTEIATPPNEAVQTSTFPTIDSSNYK